MNQPFLFKISEAPQNNSIKDDPIFYSIKEVSSLLKLSEFQVYWAVWKYRLDAFLIAGEWRVSYLAISEYLENSRTIQNQYIKFCDALKARELPGVLTAKELIDNGTPLKEISKFFQKKGEYVSFDIIKKISLRTLPVPSCDAKERDFIDWYKLQDLRLPFQTSITEWADIFKTSLSDLKEDLMSDSTIVDYPEIFSYLVKREAVNLEVFQNNNNKKGNNIKEKEEVQLSLFEGQ